MVTIQSKLPERCSCSQRNCGPRQQLELEENQARWWLNYCRFLERAPAFAAKSEVAAIGINPAQDIKKHVKTMTK